MDIFFEKMSRNQIFVRFKQIQEATIYIKTAFVKEYDK